MISLNRWLQGRRFYPEPINFTIKPVVRKILLVGWKLLASSPGIEKLGIGPGDKARKLSLAKFLGLKIY